MTSIHSNVGMGSTGGPSSTEGMTDGVSTVSTSAPNPALLKLIADMAGQLTAGKSVTTGDGLTNGRGAPALEDPPAPIQGTI